MEERFFLIVFVWGASLVPAPAPLLSSPAGAGKYDRGKSLYEYKCELGLACF